MLWHESDQDQVELELHSIPLLEPEFTIAVRDQIFQDMQKGKARRALIKNKMEHYVRTLSRTWSKEFVDWVARAMHKKGFGVEQSSIKDGRWGNYAGVLSVLEPIRGAQY